MLRAHFMQQWFALSDPAMEEALYDMPPLRQFAGLSLTRSGIPDETTIMNFRYLLEKHKLANRFLEEFSAMLAERGLLVKLGTIIDATGLRHDGLISNRIDCVLCILQRRAASPVACQPNARCGVLNPDWWRRDDS